MYSMVTPTSLFEHSTLTYVTAGILVAAVLVFLLSQPTDIAKWLQKKVYQYEVTFSLYMLSPTEKFIFSELYGYRQKKKKKY